MSAAQDNWIARIAKTAKIAKIENQEIPQETPDHWGILKEGEVKAMKICEKKHDFESRRITKKNRGHGGMLTGKMNENLHNKKRFSVPMTVLACARKLHIRR